jgi:hypothetical protein
MIGKGVLIPIIKLRVAHTGGGAACRVPTVGAARGALVLTTARKVKLSLLVNLYGQPFPHVPAKNGD